VRQATPLSLIMSDIDYFKLYNDEYGHLAGDDCLKKVATTINDTLKRPGDFAARYGGEEFVVVLPDTEINGGIEIAEAIHSNVGALGIKHTASSISDRVTISLGVAGALPEKDSEPNGLISAADKALYRAKREGRNRLEVAETIYGGRH